MKAYVIAVGFLIVVAGFGVWKFFAGPSERDEIDRNSALRDERRERIQRERQAEWWKRVVKKWNAVGRQGEQVRRKNEAGQPARQE